MEWIVPYDHGSRNMTSEASSRGRGMSHRPRVAGDGSLLMPDQVSYERSAYRAELSPRSRDPFGWTTDRLLLAEAFARLDLRDPTACRDWFEANGMVDAYWLTGINTDIGRFGPVPAMGSSVADHELAVASEQRSVAWHLGLLGLLSETRASKEWDPAWGRVVLDGAAEGLIIGGPHAGQHVSSAVSWETDRLQWAGTPEHRGYLQEQVPLHAATEGWSRAVLYDSLWRDPRPTAPDGRGFSAVREVARRADVLGTTWHETLELLRLTIEPRVQRAVQLDFTTRFVAQQVDGAEWQVLEGLEVRTWRSILHPIYLQLFEALRRISEGRPGATVCRECGRTILILDERRQLFCNDRERYRYAARERRRRMAGRSAAARSAAPGDDGATE